MKRILVILILSSMVFTACKKSGIDSFTGHYSFKMGGYVEISATKGGSDVFGACSDTTFACFLPNESGQMHIVKDDSGKLKVTMNIIGGSPVVFDATVKDQSIILAPVARRMNLYSDISLLSPSLPAVLSVSGTGKRYQDTIVFDMDLQGEYDSLFLKGNVSKSYATCIATENN